MTDEIKDAYQSRPLPPEDEIKFKGARDDIDEALRKIETGEVHGVDELNEALTKHLEAPTEPSGSVWDVIDAVADEMMATATAHGFHDESLGRVKTPLEEVALWHSECTEAGDEITAGTSLDLIYFEFKWPSDSELHAMEGTDLAKALDKTAKYQHDLQENGPNATAEAPDEWEVEQLVRAGIAKPCGYPIEAADVVIRVMDSLAYKGISLGQAIRLKAIYNVTRPMRHNKVL